MPNCENPFLLIHEACLTSSMEVQHEKVFGRGDTCHRFPGKSGAYTDVGERLLADVVEDAPEAAEYNLLYELAIPDSAGLNLLGRNMMWTIQPRSILGSTESLTTWNSKNRVKKGSLSTSLSRRWCSCPRKRGCPPR